jgi:hypothetical protein
VLPGRHFLLFELGFSRLYSLLVLRRFGIRYGGRTGTEKDPAQVPQVLQAGLECVSPGPAAMKCSLVVRRDLNDKDVQRLHEENTMPYFILWLLGVPVTVLVLLYFFGIL